MSAESNADKETTQEPSTCPKCGKAKKQEVSGSLTQWIASCTCEQFESAPEQITPIDICKQCGKQLGTSRSGSFTQWIFRREFCSCQFPVLETPIQIREDAVAASAEAVVVEDQKEIQVPDFPSDRYLAFKKLGSGLLSDVYLSKDKLLDKLVAVKIMRALSPNQVVAFQKEAKATSALNHPNIVKVLDFGASSSGTPYMVLEYIDGQSLESYIKQKGALDWTKALIVVKEVSSALSVAHEHGIYHRDIKPGNILLLEDDSSNLKALLIDFGIAAKQADLMDSEGSDFSGTPAYMSPEQVNGKFSGAPSDIFAIGCVLFECLTGKQLFDSDENALVNRSQESILEWDGIEVPDEIKAITKRCLAVSTEERFQSAADLNSAIQSSLTSEPDSIEANLEEPVPDVKNIGSGSKLGLGVFAIISLCTVSYFAINFVGNKDNDRKPKSIKSTSLEQTQKKETTSQSAFDEMHRTVSEQKVIDEINLSGPETTDATLTGLSQKQVKKLRLSRSSITDDGLIEVGKIKTLESLYLNKANLITADGLEHLTNLENLTYLNLNGTRLTKKALPVVARIKSLKSLRLMDMKLPKDALLPLANNTHLTDIDVNRTNFGDNIRVFATIKGLEKVRVGTNGVTDNGVKALRNLQNVEMVHIQGNPITSAGLKMIVKWPKLIDLWIFDTKIKAKDLNILKQARKLEILRIDNFDLTDNNITPIRTLKTLKQLTIRNTRITDSGILKLAVLKNLELLDVVNCPNITLNGIGNLLKQRPSLVVRTIHKGRQIDLTRKNFR